MINLPINVTDGLLTCKFSLLTLNPETYSSCNIKLVTRRHSSFVVAASNRSSTHIIKTQSGEIVHFVTVFLFFF